MDLAFHNAYGPDKPWFYQRHLAGGGCAMDLGIHLVDLALWMLDFPHVEQVAGHCYRRGRLLNIIDDEVEDYVIAQLLLASGTSVQLACSWCLPAGCDADIRINLYGTQGGAAIRNVNGSFYDFEAFRFRGTAWERLAAPPDAWGGRAIVDWARRLAAGVRFDTAVVSVVEVAQTIDDIYRCAAHAGAAAGGRLEVAG
jgi:predicted dehydrogenase